MPNDSPRLAPKPNGSLCHQMSNPRTSGIGWKADTTTPCAVRLQEAIRGAHCLSAMNASVVIKSSMRLIGAGHVILRHRRGVARVLRLLAGIFRSSRAARIEGRARRTCGISRRGARGLTRLAGLARHVGRGVRVIVSAPVAGRARGRRSACLRTSRCRPAARRGSCGEPRR